MSDKTADPDAWTKAPQPEIGPAGFTLIVSMVGLFAVALATLSAAHRPVQELAPVSGTPPPSPPLKGFVNFTSEQIPFRADLYDLAAFGDREELPR